MLLELVYQSLYQAVNKMIQYWERFFDNLHETRENLLFEIQNEAKNLKENKPNKCIRISGREVTRKDMARYATTFKFRCITERYISRNLYELIREYCRDAKTEEIQSKR